MRRLRLLAGGAIITFGVVNGHYVAQPELHPPDVTVSTSSTLLSPDASAGNADTSAVVTMSWNGASNDLSLEVAKFTFWGDRYYDRALAASIAGEDAPVFVEGGSRFTWNLSTDLLADGPHPCTIGGGNRVTCTVTVSAPTTTVGVFTLAFHVHRNVPEMWHRVIYVTFEVTCSDNVFCNGEERFTSRLECQKPGLGSPKPCWAGEGHCRQHECIEEAKTCSAFPQELVDGAFVTLTSKEATEDVCGSTCDLQNCGQECRHIDECGTDKCGQPCFLALGEDLQPGDPGADGQCTGIFRQCPDDSGDCATMCQGGQCVPVDPNAQGTCVRPAALFSYPGDKLPGLYDVPDGITIPSLPFSEIFHIDATDGGDLIKPSCGSSGVRDKIVRFKTPGESGSGFVGFEIRTYSPTDTALDTLAELRGAGCVDLNVPTGFCSDDASPPGNYGSRLFGKLENGKEYDLVLSFYSDQSASDVTVVEIWVSDRDCAPQCEGKTCGDDGCGRSCGSCEEGGCCYTCENRLNCRFGDSFCTEGSSTSATDETCQPGTFTCSPDCANRQCGPSSNRCPDNNYGDPMFPLAEPITQCGTRDGECREGYACSFSDGRCKSTPDCNPLAPECKNLNLKSGKFCGSDCLWHDLQEEFIDLAINGPDLVLPSIEFTWTEVSPFSPALAEGCIGAAGSRLLMRFDTWVYNVGRIGFKPPKPETRPDLFEFSFVHAHMHYKTFARFGLLDVDTGAQLVPGGKLAYCMEDTEHFLFGPRFPCVFGTSCDDQGISLGGADLYSAVLDCQWLDLTDFVGTQGKLAVYYAEANFGRTFQEASWDNNAVRFNIYVPSEQELVDANGSMQYCRDILCTRQDVRTELGYTSIPQACLSKCL